MGSADLETELKIPVASLDEVRERLLALNAELVHPTAREVNILLDTEDGTLQRSGTALRLREYGQQCLVTFKGPTSYQGRVKVREEVEVEIAAVGPMLRVFENTGFSTAARYEKDREVWRYGSSSIVLDHTPMGDFVELEGPIGGLTEAASAIGLDPERAVQGSYISLWQKFRLLYPEEKLPTDMVFPE